MEVFNVGDKVWVKNLNSYCPTCKTPLIFYPEYMSLKNQFFCNTCKIPLDISDETGKSLHLNAIKKILIG